jgi:ADP-ribose pyrophosphatase
MNGMPHDPNRRVIYHGHKLDLALQTVTLADGSQAQREVVLHRGAVALVVRVDEERICLLRNHRYTIGRTLIEVPAGTIDPGETPEQTALREIEEETGYRAGRLSHVRSWYVSPGILDEQMHLFLCDDVTPGPSRPASDETLLPFLATWSEAMAMLRSGEITDAKTILALLLTAPTGL